MGFGVFSMVAEVAGGGLGDSGVDAVVVLEATVTAATDGSGAGSVRGDEDALAGWGDLDRARRTQADSPDDGEVGAPVGGRSVLVDWARFLPLRMSMAALAWADASSPSPSHASTEPFYHRSKL